MEQNQKRSGLFMRLTLAIFAAGIMTAIWGWGWGVFLFLLLVLNAFHDSGYIALLLMFGVQAHAGELNPKFIHAIHQVESSGRYGLIVGDHGSALGPLQIHKSYWQDSGVNGSYQQVTNYNYAVKVMTAYLNRYAPDAVKSNNFEKLARVHNGGPNGYKKKETKQYWARVKKCLDN